MKKRLVLFVFIASLFASCEKSSDSSGSVSGDYDGNYLSDVVVVPNGSVIQGDMPESTNTSDSPEMIMVDSTVSYSSGSQVRLPIQYQDNSGTGVSGVRFQIEGADNYYEIHVNAGSSGAMLLPIGLPSDLDEGQFYITITIFDNNGNVSNIYETRITVTSPMGCDVQRVSGGEGITSTLHNMGDMAGAVKIEYETYTVPDRIDVFYRGVWVAGTGSNPGPLGAVPPLANCNNPTEGYIGDNGTFCFTFDPYNSVQSMVKEGTLKSAISADSPAASNNFVEVVVSGCERGGTLWQYDISCADPNDECMQGQEGNPRINLAFDGDVDFDLHVIDPAGEEIYYAHEYSVSGGQLDVDCVCCSHGNENIYWISGTAPRGTYQYWVEFYDYCNDPSGDYVLTVTKNGNVQSQKTGTLTTVGETSQVFTFNY